MDQKIEDIVNNLPKEQRERYNTLESRIEKLMKLAENNPEQFEAEAARAKAEKLIEEKDDLLFPKDEKGNEKLTPEQQAASEAFDRAEDLRRDDALHVSVSRTSDRPDAAACYCHISNGKGETVFHAPLKAEIDPGYAASHGYDLPAIRAAKPMDDYIKDLSKALEKAPVIGFDNEQDARAFDNTLAKIKAPAALPYARLARTFVANQAVAIRNICSTAVYELHHWREPLLIKAVRIAVQTVGAAFGYAPPMDQHIKSQSYLQVIRDYRRERRDYMERMDPPLKVERLEKESRQPWRPTGTFSKERANMSVEERMIEQHLIEEKYKRQDKGKDLTVKEANELAAQLKKNWDREANKRLDRLQKEVRELDKNKDKDKTVPKKHEHETEPVRSRTARTR